MANLGPVLRSATPEDIPTLASVHIASLATSLPHRNIAAELFDYERDISEPDGKLWKSFTRRLKEENIVVAEVDRKIVGYVAWYIPKIVDDEDTGKVYKSGEHGRGLGTLLIKHAQASALAALQKLCIASEAILLPAERDKVVVLNLYCFEKNAAGIRVYSRQGFVKKGSVEEPDLKEEASFLQWEHNLTETTA